MRCREIDAHFRKLGTWVSWDNTTDTFKAGDPDREITKIAVSWKASMDALEEAHKQGANLFVSHESISVKAVNGSPEPDAAFALPSELPKFRWLESTEMTVYRCHDVWDRFPGVGVRESWQRGLELGGEIIADEYPLLVTEREPITLGDLADHILRKIGPLGQNGLLLSGDPDRVVSRIATGTGVTTNPVAMLELGAEAGIITDDFYLRVRMGVHAEELDFPTIMINHGVTEAWGIENLASYLRATFPNLEVIFIPSRCPFRVRTI
jgi:putative NIF3 family GTP cyclohydrolase 1 type 2